ncbi:MAG: M3 family oligoendopeptidase [Ktedonobacteraceae bacterium]
MIFSPLPLTSEAFGKLSWSQIEPWYHELLATELTSFTLDAWMVQWSQLSALVDETFVQHEIATTTNTADESRVQRKQQFMDAVYVPVQNLDQQIKEHLLASGLTPEGFEVPLRNLRMETGIFCEANLVLLKEDRELSDAYYALGGAQTVQWEGKEVPMSTIESALEDSDRAKREEAWRLMAARKAHDRAEADSIWRQKMHLRQQIAQNAGFPSFREYRWQQLHRADYTPDDCKAFHATVERVVVPLATYMWEHHRRRLGVKHLRPWDTRVNARSSEGANYLKDVPTAMRQTAALFSLVDPTLGRYFETLLREQCFDIEERPHKAQMGYDLAREVKHLPFIFGTVKTLDDIGHLILHEAGHAFQTFEMAHLPYLHQRSEYAVPMEFMEVASITMEFIGSMFLHKAGLCSKREEALLRIEMLERTIMNGLPKIVAVDAFQHWVYEHPEQGSDPDACRATWWGLSQRFFPSIDWSGYEEIASSGWQFAHVYGDPFYYIEYAYATLGALQIWENYLRDSAQAMRQYRAALALGTTKPLPELYAGAGASFVFDDAVLQRVARLISETVGQLKQSL